MRGTAATEAEEFHKIYNVEVLVIPTNKPMIRKDSSDVVYKTPKAKFTAIATEVSEIVETGRPVLIGTTSIEKNEMLSGILKKKGIKHQVLNAKNHQREAEIISLAGKKDTVTLATNIAGRGVDIILGGPAPTDKLGLPITKGKEYDKWKKEHDEVIELGGLHVVGTERHEARRIDNQLRGRAGRQGDPGSSKFYISLEDEIMRLFGGDQIARIMTAFKLPDDTPIEHGMVGKAIENAQIKVETHNFDTRKHLVEYDDVANKQREIIYGNRKEILESVGDKEKGSKVRDEVLDKVDQEIENLVSASTADGITNDESEKILKEFSTIVPFDDNSLEKLKQDTKKIANPEELSKFLKDVVQKLYESREKSLGERVTRDIEKFVNLSVIDTLWIQHLDTLDDLREGIGLRAAGQRDPLVEYKQEAFSLFEKLIASIDYEIVHRIFKVQVRQEPQIEKIEERGIEVHEQPKLTSTDVIQNQDQEKETEQNVNTSNGKQDERDPMEMSDQELEAEIARLEAQERGESSSSASSFSPLSANKPLRIEKIGRNDPCPCGSGLKWKKCGLVNSPKHKA